MRKLIVLLVFALLLTGCDVIRNAWNHAKPTHVYRRPTATALPTNTQQPPIVYTRKPVATVAPAVTVTLPPSPRPYSTLPATDGGACVAVCDPSQPGCQNICTPTASSSRQ